MPMKVPTLAVTVFLNPRKTKNGSAKLPWKD
jgi:hypothetical protein